MGLLLLFLHLMCPPACRPPKSYNMSQHSVSGLQSELASGPTDFTSIVGVRLSYLTFPPVTRFPIKWKTRMKPHTFTQNMRKATVTSVFGDRFWRILLLNQVGWTLFEPDLHKMTQDADTKGKTKSACICLNADNVQYFWTCPPYIHPIVSWETSESSWGHQ